MKFCPECGNNIEGAKFCAECGYKVGGAATNSAATKTNDLMKEDTLLEFSTFLFGMEDKKASVAKGIDLSLPRENYTLTNQRLLIEKQKLTTSRDEIELTDITKIEVKQGLKDKVMGVGDIAIETSGNASTILKRIKNPFEIKDAIRKAVKDCTLRNNIEYRLDL